MINDYEAVIYDAPKDWPYMDLYFIHDWHIGNCMHNPKRAKAFLDKVNSDPYAAVLVIGDMLEDIVPGSKGDIFNQLLSPHEQKQEAAKILRELGDRVIAVVPGNHERNRATAKAGLYPLYDACAIAGCENRYREHFALVDIGLGGNRGSKTEPVRYTGFIVHKAKEQKNFSSSDCIEGIDFFAYGHDHDPKDHPRARLVYNRVRRTVSRRSIEVINCGALPLDYGEYAADNAYRPSSDKAYMLQLDGKHKSITTIGFYV